MGAGKPSKHHITIIDQNFKLNPKYPQYRQQLDSKPNISYEIFDKIETVFEKRSPGQLNSIIISYKSKEEMLRYRVRHHLINTRLYILTDPKQAISQDDFDNAFISCIDSDFEKILNHIVTNQEEEVYMPLVKMNRELQKKVNLKLICPESDQQIINKFKSKLEENHLSYMVFNTTKKFKDSTLSSVSDYIVCTRKNLETVSEIIKYKFKKTKLICLLQENSEPFSQIKPAYSFDIQEIVQEIVQDDSKFGYRTEKINMIHIFKRSDDSRQQERRELIIKTIRQKYKQSIKFEVFTDQNKLINYLKDHIYSAVLFIQNRNQDINNLRQLITNNLLSHRVQLIVLQNPKFQKKIDDFDCIEKFFMLENRQPKSIDWINKFIKSNHLDIHKKMIIQQGIEIRQYETTEEYKYRVGSNRYDVSPIVLCLGSDLQELQVFLQSIKVDKSQTKIVCFDSLKNVNLTKKSKVFDQVMYYWFSSSNIKKIVQQLAKIKTISLVTNYISSEKQMEAYLAAKVNFQQISKDKNCFRLITSAFGENDNNLTLYKEEVDFILFNPSKQGGEKQTKLGTFLKDFVNIWKLGYNPVRQYKTLQKQLSAMFIFARKYEVLTIEDQDFENYYMKPVTQCNSLSQLSHAVIRIYSLPHGFAQVINRLLSEFENNSKLLRVFSPFIFCFFLNYCNFFEQRKMQKMTLKIYFEDQIQLSRFRVGDVLYNTNFLSCINLDYTQSTKSYLLIQYQFCPLKQFSFFSNLLFIEPYSFYKESVEYIFAPYSKFIIQGIESGGSNQVIRLRNVRNNNYTDIIKMFLEQNIGLDIISILRNSLEEEKIRKTLVPIDEIEVKKRALAYQQFLEAIKRDHLLTAQNKFNQAENQQQPNITFKMIMQIEKAWLYLLQGKYYESQKVLSKMNEQVDKEVRSIKLRVQDSIVKTKMTRSKILQKVPQKNYWTNKFSTEKGWKMQAKTIQWTNKFLVQKDEFVLNQKGNPNSLILSHRFIEFNQEDETAILNVQQDRVFQEYNVDEKRRQTQRLKQDRIHYESNKMAASILLDMNENASKPALTEEQVFQLHRTSSVNQSLDATSPPLARGLSMQGIISRGVEITKQKKMFEEYILQEIPEIPQVKWFTMYLDGEFKTARQDNLKRLKIKKKKHKKVSTFEFL